MSHDNDNDNEDILERNVATLLESGGDPPRMADVAKARVRKRLIDGFAVAGAVAHRRVPVRAIAAGLAAVAAIAVIALLVTGGRDNPTGQLAKAGDDTALQLADGSTAVTSPGATVEVVGARRVRVRGAVLLDVVAGATPFVVDTAFGTVEVHGTRFVVDGEPDRTTAAVVRGEVSLATASGSVILHAGEQGVAEPGRPPTRSPAPRLSHLVAWAQKARAQLEHEPVAHHGTLYGRLPNNPWYPEQPLPIAKLGVDVVVEDRVARVALDQTFHNPGDMELEGMYRFAIPPDAALQRLAMYVDGKLTESAVVERMAARRIYEEQVYKRIDPALLEWAGTGRLALRVYPLPPRQDKRLMVAYTQSLPKLYDDWTLTVPLPEVDEPVGELGFTVRVAGCANCEIESPSHKISVARAGDDATVTYHATGVQLGDSLVLHVRDPRHAATASTARDGDDRFVMVRAPADVGSAARAYRPRTWVLLDDTSASRDAMARRAQADLVDAFLRELDEDDRVAVYGFDVVARRALAATRVRDVDRAKVRAALDTDAGVGATDLGVALDAAVGELAGVAGDDAMVVYFGDGVVTAGALHLDELRAKLVGKAHFIGVGVGDGADTQTLDALAAATGGYSTTIDLADDLGWRAFDLVAALHTARVTDVTARLVDAAGADVAATAYLRAPQLADGEEVELVAKLTGAAQPVAVELAGSRDGKPWHQRIEIAGAHDNAGYLPRLWAQRHIAARLLAKNEPVAIPPCAVAAPRAHAVVHCTTEEEARDARDEVIRKDIVELGKKYFLLSRHTSLLVLENDAMYAQYGITKGTGATWAPYAMPATIPVAAPTSPIGELAGDVLPLRAPLQVFAQYGGWYGNRAGPFGGVDTRGFFGDGWGGGRSGEWRLGLAPDPAVLMPRHAFAKAFERQDLARDKAPEESKTESTTGEVATAAATEKAESITTMQQTVDQDIVDTRRAVAFHENKNVSTYWENEGDDLYAAAATGQFYPQRLVYPGDSAFDDLSALVPALVAGPIDAWQQQIAGGAKPLPIDPAAAALLARARAALTPGVYRWGDAQVAVDSTGNLGWTRTVDTGLDERAALIGRALVRDYPELGLTVRRANSSRLAVALAMLPIAIAADDDYRAAFAVRARGDHAVALTRPGAGGARDAFVLSFDDAAHLVAIADGEGNQLLTVTWGASGPIAARVDGAAVTVGYDRSAVGDAATWARGGAAPDVEIELPLRTPASWATRLAALTPGGDAWRAAQRQNLASLAAAQDYVGLATAYRALVDHGGASIGDLALAGQSLATLEDGPAAAALAPLRDTAVGRYFAAGRRYARSLDVRDVPDVHEPGLLPALWSLRTIAADLAAGRAAPAMARAIAMADADARLKLLAVATVATRLPADGKVSAAQIASLWDAVGAGERGNLARAQAAMTAYRIGNLDAATELVARYVDNLDLTAPPAAIPGAPYLFEQSRRGHAGWEMVWARWRDRVLAGTSFEHALALVDIAASQPTDAMRVIARAAELAGGDVDRGLAVAAAATRQGQLALAEQLVDKLAARSSRRAVHDQLAALALQQGRTAQALEQLEAAQDAPDADDGTLPLQVETAQLSEILTLAQNVAVGSTGAARDAVLRDARRFGARWRELAPNEPAVDLALGNLALAVGDTVEAWRQLSTAIERDPMSGDGYQLVADAFETQGKVAEAVGFWDQAVRIDQTNPTPRLREAKALAALGRDAEADKILRDIAGRAWHVRWDGVVGEARALLERRK